MKCTGTKLLLIVLGLPILTHLNAAQTATIAEGFVTTEDHVRLAYRVVGSGAQVLVIPGGYSSLARDFSAFARGRKLIVYDQRSRGHSDAVKDSSHLGIDYEVRDLETVRQYFHVERMSLIGCSYLGGMIVLYALEHPEHVERLMLVDPIPYHRDLYTLAEDTLDSRLDKTAVDRLERLRKAGLDKADPAQFCRETDKLYNPPYFGDPDAAAKYHTPCELQNEQADNADRTWDAIERSLGNWDWRARIKSIKSPTLVIYGTKDWIPESAAREWVATLPKARLLLLPGAGHISWFEQSDRIFSAVDSFLNGSWPKGSSASSRVEGPTGKDAAETVPNPHDERASPNEKDTEKELIQLEKDFAEATLKHDREFYDRIIADDWINVHEDGSIGTKQGDAAHKSEYDTATYDDIKVRVYGVSAVAVGRYSVSWSEGGRRSTASGRFTDTWVRRNGRWQIVSTQNTPFPEATAPGFPPDAFFIAKEKEVWEAIKNKDKAAATGLLADDFVGMGDTGYITKSEWIKQIDDEQYTVDDYTIENAKLLRPSANTALLLYTSNCKGTGTMAEVCNHASRISDLWVERNGQWVDLFSQDAQATSSESDVAVLNAILSSEKQIVDALSRDDIESFGRLLPDDVVEIWTDGVHHKPEWLRSMEQEKKDGYLYRDFRFEDPKLVRLGPDQAILTATEIIHGLNKGKPVEDRLYTMACYVRRNGKWVPRVYQDTPIQ